MKERTPHLVMASGPGICFLALTENHPAGDLIPRFVPACDTIASRSLRPGEAQFLRRVIPEIVR